MRWIFCLITLFIFFCASAQKSSFLDKEIVFAQPKSSIREVFEHLQGKGITTSYNNKNINLDAEIVLPQKSLSVRNLVKLLETEYTISSKIKNYKIIFIQNLQKYTLSGFVKEVGSSESLPGANITISDNYGTFSNSYGFYSITLPKGNYEISTSYIGYTTEKVIVSVQEDMQLDFLLKSSTNKLENIVITPCKEQKNSQDFSQINLEETNKLPATLGTDDAIKRLHTITGTGGVTGFSELLVRGGNINENLVLLDGVPIYNYNHFPGLLSIFNTESLKSINFYKGLFPARYGGRLSSVTDIKMREGNMESYHIGGTIDLATLSLFVEGPILKNKASFIISGRRSWIDALTKLGDDDENFNFFLQDINLKVNYIPNSDNRLYVSIYKGKDKFGDSFSDSYDKGENLSWGNEVLALRWNHIFSDKVFSNTLLALSNFENNITTEGNDLSNSSLENNYKLKEFNYTTDIEYFNDFYELKTGVGIQKNNFKTPTQANNVFDSKLASTQYKIYFENNVKFSKKLHTNIGLNYVLYRQNKFKANYFQPRIKIKYYPTKLSSISIGFSEMHQFIHQLDNSSISFPYAFRLPSSKTLNPSVSRLYEFNYRTNLRKGKDKLFLATYYKKQENILRYCLGQDLFNKQLAENWEDQVTVGQRKVFGVEFSYFADFKPLKTTLAYSFIKNREQFEAINKNEFYPNAKTPRHSLTISNEYEFNKKHSIALSFAFNSGLYTTLPLYKIPNIDHSLSEKETSPSEYSYVEGATNGFQLKDNYHLDLGYTFQILKGEFEKHIFKLGVQNLLGKPAPFRATSDIFEGKLSITETTLPAPLPYISYTFKF